MSTIVVAGCNDGSVTTQPSGHTTSPTRPQGTGPVQQLVLKDGDMPTLQRTEIGLGKENGNFPTHVAGSSTTHLLLLQFIEEPPFVVFDRETRQERPVPIEGSFTGDVRLSDRWIVWSEAPSGTDGWSLSYCAVADLKAKDLVSGSFSRSFVPTIAVDEDFGVWIENARQEERLEIVAAAGEDCWILPGASHRNDPSLMIQTNLQDAGSLSGIKVTFIQFAQK